MIIVSPVFMLFVNYFLYKEIFRLMYHQIHKSVPPNKLPIDFNKRVYKHNASRSHSIFVSFATVGLLSFAYHVRSPKH